MKNRLSSGELNALKRGIRDDASSMPSKQLRHLFGNMCTWHRKFAKIARANGLDPARTTIGQLWAMHHTLACFDGKADTGLIKEVWARMEGKVKDEVEVTEKRIVRHVEIEGLDWPEPPQN